MGQRLSTSSSDKKFAGSMTLIENLSLGQSSNKPGRIIMVAEG
jgi:hypothetical protein